MIRSLPRRVPLMLAGVVIVGLAAFQFAVDAARKQIDAQAAAAAVRIVSARLGDLREDLARVTRDYNQWTDAYLASQAGDAAWLSANYAATAVSGEVFDGIVIFGGPFEEPMGWVKGGDGSPGPSHLPAEVLDRVAAEVAGQALGEPSTFDAFVVVEGRLLLLSASRLEPHEAEAARALDPADLAIAVITRTFDPSFADFVVEALRLRNFAFTEAPAPGLSAVPVFDPDGRMLGALAWTAFRPGSALVSSLSPVLWGGAAAFLALGAAAALLAHALLGRLVAGEAEAQRLARTDSLTGLPNRLAFNEALAPPALAGERALLFLDLNGFKRINDSLGHDGGDLVIARLAERLDALRGDGCLLAHIGGDEFVFVLAGPRAGLRVERLAQAVARTMQEPVAVRGHDVRLGAAIGYAVQDADDASGADLLRQAGLAMYQAKRHRRGAAVAFGAMIEEADRDARAIEGALRGALAQGPRHGGEFAIAYQPIVDVATGRMMRAEALARWTSPTLGPVPPDRFIAVAEEAGLIVELGRQLLSLICGDLRAHPDLHVSLNVSPLQLTAPTFVPDLVNELVRHGVSPARIEVEITERVLVDDPVLAARRIDELHAAGFRTALDDFGQGHSSIGTLQRMAFDTLKIDRAFVSGLGASGERLTLCNAMILLGRGLGLAIVCEGVETAKELELLRELDCGLAQGYQFDRPQPIGALVARWLGPTAAEAAVA